MPWSRDVIAADAVGVLVDADRIAVCNGVEVPAHFRTVDGAPSDLASDQLGRVTTLYIAAGSLPDLTMHGRLTVCDRGADGLAVRPGVEYTVLDVLKRGPFQLVMLSVPQVPASGAVFS